MIPSGEAQCSRDRLLRQPTAQAAILSAFAEVLPGCVLLHFGANLV